MTTTASTIDKASVRQLRALLAAARKAGQAFVAIGVDDLGVWLDDIDPAAIESPDDATPAWVQHEWNTRKHARQVASRKLTPALMAALRARIKEIPKKTDWTALIDRLAREPFYCGERAAKDGSRFYADLAFIAQPGKALRILETVRHAETLPSATPGSAKQAAKTTRDSNVDHVSSGGIYRPEER